MGPYTVSDFSTTLGNHAAIVACTHPKKLQCLKSLAWYDGDELHFAYEGDFRRRQARREGQGHDDDASMYYLVFGSVMKGWSEDGGGEVIVGTSRVGSSFVKGSDIRGPLLRPPS
jgi:hypothetical protein